MINKTENLELRTQNLKQETARYTRNLEELKGRNDPEAVKEVAKQMEALFAYEMIKAMRETTETMSKGGLGGGAYLSMFDMELSKLFAERGMGLQDMILKGLNREQNSTEVPKYKSKEVQKTERTIEQQGKSAEARKIGSAEVQKHGSSEDMKVRSSEVQKPGSYENKDMVKNESVMPSYLPNFLSSELPIPVDGRISSNYGKRKHPVYGDKRFHNGVDIAAPEGTKVYPVRNGKVVFSGEQSGYGNMVIIDHGNGLISKYGHNRLNMVKVGDKVDTNMPIAEIGSTGVSTGPHLHFEVRYEGKSIDPSYLIAKK
jgi:murein DD-endopeptidase MepM/ murein hydrolase activator NlpD